MPLLAQVAERYTGVESHPLSAQLAQKNFPEATILTAAVENFKRMDADVVIVDPPRSGLHRKVLGRLIGNKIDRIIYISCSPASLTRDLKEFFKHGYHLANLELLDLFPQTPHVEALAVLQRSPSGPEPHPASPPTSE